MSRKQPTQLEFEARALVAQMHAGPWPVTAPKAVWTWAERRGWVRAVPALGEHPAGWLLCSGGYEALERLGWFGELPTAERTLPFDTGARRPTQPQERAP